MAAPETGTPETLTAEPREGHDVVVIRSHAEWPGGETNETVTVDAAWWDSLTPEQREAETTDIAVTTLSNHASSGAWEHLRRPAEAEDLR